MLGWEESEGQSEWRDPPGRGTHHKGPEPGNLRAEGCRVEAGPHGSWGCRSPASGLTEEAGLL